MKNKYCYIACCHTYRVTFAVGFVTLRPSLTRSIRKLQHISREKDMVHFNKQQCNTRDYVLNGLFNNLEI